MKDAAPDPHAAALEATLDHLRDIEARLTWAADRALTSLDRCRAHLEKAIGHFADLNRFLDAEREKAA